MNGRSGECEILVKNEGGDTRVWAGSVEPTKLILQNRAGVKRLGLVISSSNGIVEASSKETQFLIQNVP